MIHQGDALTILKSLKAESINCCVTSPPYWALRDYGVEGQLGLEPTFQEYITKLCDIFDEVKRVLRKDGTCWVNLGDTYNAGGNYRGKELDDSSKEVYRRVDFEGCKNDKNAQGIEAKCLCQIPSRFSIEMCNRGWILRNTIIWHKPNCMPSSVKDRFTMDFEYIFFFVKSKKYWFEQQKEPIAESSYNDKQRGRIPSKNAKWDGFQKQTIGKIKSFAYIEEGGRNKRCVWSIPPKPFKDAHFAVFPEELVETPIKAGCPVGGVILDPFCGSGTTGVVAKKQNKQFVGIELNSDYIKMAEKRITNTESSLL